MIEFTYYGEIRGKGRPRFRSAGPFIQTYTDKETQNYENNIRNSFLMSSQEPITETDIALGMKVNVYQTPPESTSKVKRNRMLVGDIRPTKKPDADNILKSILDGLNKVAYPDDRQIVEISISKNYSTKNKIEVQIYEIREKGFIEMI